MHVKGVHDPEAGGCATTRRGRLAFTGLSMALGTLLVACVETGNPPVAGGGADARPGTVDVGESAVDVGESAVDAQTVLDTVAALEAGDPEGTDDPSEDRVGGEDAAGDGEANAEATMDDGAARPDADETNEGARGDNADEVTRPPDERGAGSPDAGSPDESEAVAPDEGDAGPPDESDAGSPDESDGESPDEGDAAGEPARPDSPSDGSDAEDALSDAVSLVGGDVLPPVQPVSGTDAKLDGVLLELLRARRAGGDAGAAAYAAQHQPGLSLDGLRVQIVCESADEASTVREQVAEAGGTVTASFENYLWAEVSLGEIEGLAQAEAVWTLSVSQAVVQPRGVTPPNGRQ